MSKQNKIFTLLIGCSYLLSGCGGTPEEEQQSSKKEPEVHEHIDNDKNHLCDVCSFEMSKHVDNDKNHLCDICEYQMSKHTDFNYDHYCDYCGEKSSEHTFVGDPHICDLCREKFDHIDMDIDGDCDFCGVSWSEDEKRMFNERLGELLPYFVTSTDFEEKTDYLEATVEGDATENIVKALTGTGKYTSEKGLYLDKEATYITKPSNQNEFSIVTVMVLYNSITNISYVDAYTRLLTFDEFPLEYVNKYIKDYTQETVIVPDDGELFLIEKGETEGYCLVTFDGSAEAYLEKLKNANYYLDYSMFDYYAYDTVRALSPGRTLAVQVTDKTSEVTIEFMGVEAPNETEWSELIQSYMMQLFGEIVPFVNAGFTADKETCDTNIEEKGYFQLESYNIDAFKYAVEAMRTDSSYKEEYTEDGGFYTFSKEVGYFVEEVVISVLWGTTTMSFLKVFPTYTSWPVNQINYCLGDDTFKDVIPAADGDSFYLYYEDAHPYIANLTVYGTHQNYVDYLTALEGEDYKITTLPDGWVEAIGKNEDISMYLFDCTQNVVEGDKAYYKVEIHRYIPEPTTTTFPMEAVLTELDDEINFNCPIPTGETFTPSYPYGKNKGQSDIIITITGGDRAAYIEACENAGYNHYSSYDYSNYKAYINWNTHLAIYIYDTGSNTDYAVEYGVAFEL